METTKKESSVFMRLAAIIISIAMICAGGYLLFMPRHIVLFFSFGVAVYGLLLIVRYISAKETRNGWDLIAGIINLIFGAMLLFGGAPEKVFGLIAIELYIGVWAIFSGVSQFFGSLGLKKQGAKGWGWMLVGGILTLICGFMLLSKPLMGVVIIAWMAGIYVGVMFLIMGFTGLAAALSNNPQISGEEIK